jgi:uncharacterized protein YndB with AHSA1/START domain
MTSSVIAAEASIEVPLAPDAAFDLYTRGIDRWWRLGTRYWNDGRRAVGLRFEPFVGGRFIEVHDAASGDGFEIGRVTVWEPGRRLVYTWREQDWDAGASTEVEVTFQPIATGTRVELRHTGWESVEDCLDTSRGYSMGAAELLGWYREASTAG